MRLSTEGRRGRREKFRPQGGKEGGRKGEGIPQVSPLYVERLVEKVVIANLVLAPSPPDLRYEE